LVTFRQGFYPNIVSGVAVGPGRGAPLMRLFKASQLNQSEEDRVRDARLTYIAQRYRPERPIGPVDESSAEAADHPEDQGNEQ
jgi:hypothetical protein